jgi:hypothetical protein
MKGLRIFVLLALTSLVALAGVGSASAAPTDPLQYKFSFDGEQLPGGGFAGVGSIAVNEATGNVLVLDGGRIDQFDANGNPVEFSALGSPTISLGGGEIVMVDNGGGATQGNIYVFAFNESFGQENFWAYGPTGESLAANPQPMFVEVFEGFTGAAAVGPDGTLWAFYSGFDGSIHAAQMTPSGHPAGVEQVITGPGGLGPAAIDGLGNFYLPGQQSLGKFDSANNFANLGETGLAPGAALAIEPSTNDVYSRQGGKILGVHYSDPLVASTPFEAINGVNTGGGGLAFDPTGQTLYIGEATRVSVFHREPPVAPFGLGQLRVDGVRSSRAVMHGQLAAGGLPTSYRFEYGTDSSYGSGTASVSVPLGYFPVAVSGAIEGLQPNTIYHVRIAATNPVGTSYGPDRVFRTYGVDTSGSDPCPNALARKQTSAQRLPDCRAYELVSAADTGGYDVESYLAPGQTPLPGFPEAQDRLLYSTHSGAIPGPWNATNKGPDPYLATRAAGGWTTSYEGLPANLNPAAGSFSSVLGEADSGLTTLAFAGPGLCSPCFTGGGLETGIPVRMPNGELVQGMAGSLDPGAASAKPEGKVAKYFSADGHHLVFASKYAFETGANTGGDLTVYDRDLLAGTTQIVSTDPSGATLTGAGISELDISVNGSRIVVGKRVATDSEGNEYVHPYLHLGSSPDSVDLAPGTTSGVLFAGMTADGSRVFFTTVDKLLPADTDTSADLYEAEVDPSGALHLALVGGANSNACSPVANSARTHWNSVGAGANCDAVAIGGGGGVASESGIVYFLSPEQLDGTNGALNQPNLYLAEAGGTPRFIATLEPDNPLVLDSVKAAATRRTGDFQTTPSGNFAAFVSDLELTGVFTFGFLDVFRYDAVAGQLDCASCDTTGTNDSSLAEDAALAPDGLSLLEDGRVLFTSRLELVLNDANRRKDAYQWSDGVQKLISAGAGPFDSALLTASADGTDVFFFTHEALAPEEDSNGSLMRIYDAREGGGFFKLPAAVPCQASDECHGPGTATPAAPDIRSSGKTTQGNFVTCKKNQVKRGGKCVKKTQPKKHKKHATAKQGKGKRHA